MAILLREGYPNWARSVNSTLNVEEPVSKVFENSTRRIARRANTRKIVSPEKHDNMLKLIEI